MFTDILKRNVIDYLTGTLVGLDTHDRKNRSGQNFQVLCENLIISVASKYNLTFYKQVRFKDIENDNLKFTDGLHNKIADIVLVKNGKALNIELNYFETGGSKPNEIIESYINRKNELRETGNYFILISDGLAWKQNSHNQLIKHLTTLK
ncbi:DpnII family type II restriction endonuclease [Mycoplasmopsis agalactiae]|uniref:DpnII family type II restriction endonuclease n=1 Tax=Mycoplasmopsis agalactiae TaxID=2110 RepID=UPI002803E91F|nr:DpnII family type II restriction endonuclease [Mycoplasmopsis agalactiae]